MKSSCKGLVAAIVEELVFGESGRYGGDGQADALRPGALRRDPPHPFSSWA